MATSTEIKQRANALADKTDVNSITPKEVGGIMYDLASHSENVLRNGGTLGIRKVYESVAAMEADSTNPKDFWGDPIKKGNLVVIYDGTTTGVDNNKIYAFMKPGWELATKLDAAYATKAETDAKLSELGSEIRNLYRIDNYALKSDGTLIKRDNFVCFDKIQMKNGDSVSVSGMTVFTESTYANIVIYDTNENVVLYECNSEFSYNFGFDGYFSVSGIYTNQIVIKTNKGLLWSAYQELKSVEKKVPPSSYSLSIYNSDKPCIEIDFNTKKIKSEGIIIISNGSSVVVNEQISSETDFVGINSNLIVGFVVYNISEKKFSFVSYSNIEEYKDFNSVGERLHYILGAINKNSGGVYGIGFAFSHIKIDGKSYYGNVGDINKENLNIFPIGKNDLNIFPINRDDVEFVEKERTENMFNKQTCVGGYYGKDGVTFQSSSDYHCSDFIPVEVGYSYKRNGNKSLYVYAYDSEKKPIAVNGTDVYWSLTFENIAIPSGVSFIRVIFYPNELNNYMVVRKDVDESAYIPYYTYTLAEDIKVSSNVDVHINDYGISDVGNLRYNEIDTCDYSQIIMYGQSLSMGWEAPEAIKEEPIPNVYMIGNKVAIRHGNNGQNVLTPLESTLASSCGENPTVAAINAFASMYRRFVSKSQKFIATSCGEGGQSIEKLSKECTNGTNYYNDEFLNAVNRTKATVSNEGKSVGCFAILYMQGEHNYTGLSGAGLISGTDATNDKDTYKMYLKNLKENMQADIMEIYGQKEKPLFFIYEVAGYYINRFDMSINMAQVEFALENDDVFLLPPTYSVPDYNGGHLSTNGYRWYGEMIAKSLYNVFVRGKRFFPIMPKNYTIDGSFIKIDMYVPVLPLVLDTWTKETVESMGFRVQQNDADIAIKNVRLENNSVVIECMQPLTGKVAVAYAGQNRNGSGNLRDSDTWSSLYTYYDDSLNDKKENYTPLDKPNGNKIYNKPYPMFNWCGNFYKLIQEN